MRPALRVGQPSAPLARSPRVETRAAAQIPASSPVCLINSTRMSEVNVSGVSSDGVSGTAQLLFDDVHAVAGRLGVVGVLVGLVVVPGLSGLQREPVPGAGVGLGAGVGGAHLQPAVFFALIGT